MSHVFRQVTEAVFTKGVLKPLRPLEDIEESEKVRLFIEKIDSSASMDRSALIAKFLDGVDRMDFRSKGRFPHRDELHDRD